MVSNLYSGLARFCSFPPVVPVLFDGVDAALDSTAEALNGEQPSLRDDAVMVLDPEEMMFANPFE